MKTRVFDVVPLHGSRAVSMITVFIVGQKVVRTERKAFFQYCGKCRLVEREVIG